MRAQTIFAAAILVATSVVGVSAQTTLIRNATVIDGTGSASRRADIRVSGDRISAVGQLTPTAGERVVDAAGLTIAPGFIDTHSHHDRGLTDHRDALAMVSQGVTTIVVGQEAAGRISLRRSRGWTAYRSPSTSRRTRDTAPFEAE